MGVLGGHGSPTWTVCDPYLFEKQRASNRNLIRDPRLMRCGPDVPVPTRARRLAAYQLWSGALALPTPTCALIRLRPAPTRPVLTRGRRYRLCRIAFGGDLSVWSGAMGSDADECDTR